MVNGYCSFKKDLYYEGRLIWKKDVRYDILFLVDGMYVLMTEDYDIGNMPFATRRDEEYVKEFVCNI